MRSTMCPPRRVLHVLAAYDPKEAQGRCVRTIASLAPGEHFLACSSLIAGGGEFRDVVETGVEMTQFGWKDRRRLGAAVEQIRPDVIHFHGGPIGAATTATRWSGGVPVVATIYSWPTVGSRSVGHGVSLRHLRTTILLASHTVANTLIPRSLLAALLRSGGVEVVTTTDPAVREVLASQAIPVGLIEGITPPRPDAVVAPIRGHFLFAGRAELTRGPDMLAQAVQRLRLSGLPVTARFCFLGAPNDRMVSAAAASGGCTASLGGVNLEDEMSSATAVVLPFRFDEATLVPALVATEAMAAGVPVVGGDVRCLRGAVTDGYSGLLVAPGDVGALARALERLARDPEFARSLGRNGAAQIERRWATSSIVDLAGWSYDIAMTGTRSSVRSWHGASPASEISPIHPEFT